MVLALQEWRHWLEGATHPFIVWTDHKNLAYLRTQDMLTVSILDRRTGLCSHRPGSCNTKPDALSHQFTLEVGKNSEEIIVDPTCVLGAIRWRVEQEAQEAFSAQLGTPVQNSLPSGGPPNPGSHQTVILVALHDR